jgi:hypothetical protein
MRNAVYIAARRQPAPRSRKSHWTRIIGRIFLPCAVWAGFIYVVNLWWLS